MFAAASNRSHVLPTKAQPSSQEDPIGTASQPPVTGGAVGLVGCIVGFVGAPVANVGRIVGAPVANVGRIVGASVGAMVVGDTVGAMVGG